MWQVGKRKRNNRSPGWGWLHVALLASSLGLIVAMAGCDLNADPSPTPAGASPTTTQTPAGEVLVIDDQPVREVLIPDPQSGALYAVTDQQLYALDGDVWIPVAEATLGRHYIIDPTDADHLFRGDHLPCTLDSDEKQIPLEVSKDGGDTWRELTLGTNIRPLAFDPTDPEVLYGSNCALMVSTNSGNTWELVNALPGHTVTDVAIVRTRLLLLGATPTGESMLREVDITDPRNPEIGDILLRVPGPATMDVSADRIVVGGAETVHVSDDGGVTWYDSRIGLEQVTTASQIDPDRTDQAAQQAMRGIRAIQIDPRDKRRIYAGTSRGVFVSQDGGVTWVRYDEIPPDATVNDLEIGANDIDLYVTTDKGVIVVPVP